LYAYELPSPQPVPSTNRSESPDELDRQRRLQQVRRVRTLSLKQAEEAREAASLARENLARRGLREGSEEGEVEIGEEVLGSEGAGSEGMEVCSAGREAEVANGASHEHMHKLIKEMSSGGMEVEDGEVAESRSEEAEQPSTTAVDESLHREEEGCGLEEEDQKLTDDVGDQPMECEEGVVREGADHAIHESVAVLAGKKEDMAMEVFPPENNGGAPMDMKEAWDSDDATNILEVQRQLPAYESYVYAMHRRPVSGCVGVYLVEVEEGGECEVKRVGLGWCEVWGSVVWRITVSHSCETLHS